APGTGKTVFAEAFAHELDIPFMEVMNTFNQFVGVSEQNMQNLLDVAWAQRPVVLFFDEIEQLLLPRGSVYHGDSGVFARSSRMLMQFFSDPKIHGQVLIFAATNRPDLLDVAMKRAGRFGAKIPFLIPTKAERPSIWKALLRKEVIRLGLMRNSLDISRVINDEKLIEELSGMVDFWEKDGGLIYGPPDPNKFSGEVISLTGAEMEDIIGLAFQPFLEDLDISTFNQLSKKERCELLSEKYHLGQEFVLTGDMLKEAIKNYLPREDVRTYNAMNDMALLSVNDLRFIPPAYRDRARKLRTKQRPPETFLP
ncbi:MAG: ATP-binding protein, partial [Candidatus Roizmanbacteria bacterium]|nr:ATP-binding protein [Candidatus Roizmanbacteria bacterium]